MSRLWQRLRLFWTRRQWEQQLEDELQFHVDMRAARLREEGCSDDEAARRARVELGMQQLHRDEVRHAWGLRRLDEASQALRLALRSVARSPGFSCVAVTVLALPLSLCVMLYALFSAYALQAPAVQNPERWFYLDGRSLGAERVEHFTVAEAAALVADPPEAAEGLFSHRGLSATLTTDRDYRGLGEAVSDNLFALAGLPAARGRLWFGGDDPRDQHTLLLSARGASKLFGEGQDPLGQRVDIAGTSFAVIGVVGAGYSGLLPVGALYWIRVQDRPRHVGFGDEDSLSTEVGGFRRPGIGVDALTAALSARASALSLDRNPELRLSAIEAVQRRGLLREGDRDEAILAGTPVVILVVLILLVAAANLANLVLARFSARRHDLALRAALGASRGRLFAGMLLECVLLGQAASMAALAAVALLMQPIHNAVFGLIADLGFDLLSLHMSWDAAAFCVALGLLASICFGALPAWWLTAPYAASGRADPDANALKKSEPRGLRGGLMTLQLAGSVFLIVLAGLVATNARITRDAEIGFEPASMVAIDGIDDDGRLARELSLLPGVAGLAATSSVPFMQPMLTLRALRDGREDRLQVRYIDAAWWGLLGIELRAGRNFSTAEGASSPAAIVSERAAQQLWPDRPPLGETLRLQGEAVDGTRIDSTVEVVGVARDVASGWLFGDPLRAVVYLPAMPGSAEAPTLLLRLRDATPAAVAALERDCLRLAPEASCRPMRISDALRVQRLPFAVASRLSSGLAWLALAISCIGLYGLVSYAVVQQRKALGVRMALGANATDVVRHVMRGAAQPLAFGLMIGLPLAWGLSRGLAALTEHLRTFSLEAFLLDPLLLVGVALAAAWIPARRAARIAPAECLRADQ